MNATRRFWTKTINKLRDRVGMKHLTTDVGFTDPNWPKWEVPISPLLNEIRRERRVELACEGLRWNDLCRWKAGKLLENIKTYLGPRDPATGEYRVVYPGMTRTWYDRLYLYPIPTDEFTFTIRTYYLKIRVGLIKMTSFVGARKISLLHLFFIILAS